MLVIPVERDCALQPFVQVLGGGGRFFGRPEKAGTINPPSKNCPNGQFPLTHISLHSHPFPPNVPDWELAKLVFPLQFDATTPRLCKSVLSSASEPAGGSFSTWAARQVFRPKCILASGLPDCVAFWRIAPLGFEPSSPSVTTAALSVKLRCG